MTCIVGLEHDGHITIGGDTAGTDGWLGQHIRTDDKVWADDGYTFGFTTSYRMGQLLRYSLNLPVVDSWDVDRFMATRFVDAVRDCLKTGGYAETDKGVESGGTFLVGVQGRLYTIGSYYQIGRASCGYAAVGCGGDLALGSMHTTSRFEIPPADRIELALDAASYHSAAVAGPYTVVTGVAA